MKKPLRVLCFLLVLLPAAGTLAADADIRDTTRLVFVADREAPFIDVVDPGLGEKIYRIDTQYPVHDLVVTPYAPLLIYTNRDEKKLFTFNLEKKAWMEPLALPMTPRHVILDTSGSKIGITDSAQGGFTLVSAYTGQILFHLPDLPPTGDVLFDPNEIDVFYTNDAEGALGLIDINLERFSEIRITADTPADLSSPSRSLDGRYVYVANHGTGDVYNMNAYSKVIHKTFATAGDPARPYTTPEGLFLYQKDHDTGRHTTYDQNRFAAYADVSFGAGIDLVTVGRADRMNLFMSSAHAHYYLYDNARRRLTGQGSFQGTPLDAKGSVDGKTAFVAFADAPMLALVDLESGAVSYVPATENGAGAFGIGLTNNVCH